MTLCLNALLSEPSSRNLQLYVTPLAATQIDNILQKG